MRLAILAFSLAACISCTTLEPIQSLESALVPASSVLAVGDRIEVVTRSGVEFSAAITELRDTSIVGMTTAGETIAIDHANIAQLGVRRFAKGKTVALGFGLGFALIAFLAPEEILPPAVLP